MGILRRTHDALPSSVITVNGDGVVSYVNATARQMLPTVSPGRNLREVLEEITHVEMVDRLLIRRELATFAAVPGGPDLYWIVWEMPDPSEELVLTVWEVDWSEVMNERRAAFTMAASHEMRGPLTTIQGFAEILNMDTSNMSAEQAEAAAIIESTARHLSILVDDVFDLSRNSFGELRLNLCDIDMAAVVNEVVSVTRPGIEERGQNLVSEIQVDMPRIRADEARAFQMVSNLVNNASIHNEEGITIRVTAAVEGGYVSISVEDDGKGLPFNDPEEAFRTFRRGADSSAGVRTGSGIGLSITKRLIQLHRGGVEVESSRGSGAKFTLWFPIDRESAVEPDEPGPA